MIKIDITTLIFFYILLYVIGILLIWVFSAYKKTRRIIEPANIENIWKCSICLNTYVDSLHEDISVCPLCGSYNKKDKSFDSRKEMKK